MLLLPERDAELCERAAQARPDRALREAEEACDLLERQLEPVVQDDDEAPRLAQLRHGVRDRPELELLLRMLPEGPGVELLGLAAALSAQEVDGAVDRDSLQPRPERTGLIEAPERAERVLDRVLGGVVCQDAVGQ